MLVCRNAHGSRHSNDCKTANAPNRRKIDDFKLRERSVNLGVAEGAPVISIVIPTLQEEKVIGSTLSLLRTGDEIPCEIIVSDGGSTDRTLEIARRLADRVIEHHSASRQTIAQGRNFGAKSARGEFLVFLDADCSVTNPNQFLASARGRFASDPKLVALTALLRVLPANETLGDKLVFGVMNLATRFRNNVLQKGDAPGGEFQMVRRSTMSMLCLGIVA